MKIKKLATVALTAVMALNMCATSFAAETTQENGDYTGTIHFYKATDLNGKLTIQAPTFGKLTSEENELVFTNTFGTQVVDADTEGTTLNGTLGVAATAVKAAVAGNYTGTTTFTISYAAN